MFRITIRSRNDALMALGTSKCAQDSNSDILHQIFGNVRVHGGRFFQRSWIQTELFWFLPICRDAGGTTAELSIDSLNTLI